ncbi:unnamed protein product, partial [Ixodes pacificus]
TAIWPIQLTINELPAPIRMGKLVLAALWFGKSKPRMDVFQNVFVDQVNNLSVEGFSLLYKGATETFKAFCICCAVDSVARAPMQGILQFNGYYGCNWCLHPGERHGGSVKYPTLKDDPPERTEIQMIADMEEALDTGTVVRGVRTASPLINLEHFDIVWGFVPDYMHCVLLGVGRQFLEYWLEATREEFYIGNRIAELDQKLLAMRPPKDVRRMPRSLKERKFWKAKELENWILYYSVPVLDGLLPNQYLRHWALLVESLHVMLGKKISVSDIDAVDGMMLEFMITTQLLYEKHSMTYNLHQLGHLVKSVRLWGPLWSHSAFPFESGNGFLKARIKAANGIPQQICRAMALQTAVCKLSEQTVNAKVLQYCSSLDLNITQKTMLVSGEGVRFFGKEAPYVTFRGPLRNSPAFSSRAVEFQRMIKDKSILTTYSYSLNKKTNNSFVELADGTIGRIEKIVYDISTFVILTPLKCLPAPYFPVSRKNHFHRVSGDHAYAQVVPISEISNVCTYVMLQSKFIVAVPSALTF